jgi:hypothetical protein
MAEDKNSISFIIKSIFDKKGFDEARNSINALAKFGVGSATDEKNVKKRYDGIAEAARRIHKNLSKIKTLDAFKKAGMTTDELDKFNKLSNTKDVNFENVLRGKQESGEPLRNKDEIEANKLYDLMTQKTMILKDTNEKLLAKKKQIVEKEKELAKATRSSLSGVEAVARASQKEVQFRQEALRAGVQQAKLDELSKAESKTVKNVAKIKKLRQEIAAIVNETRRKEALAQRIEQTELKKTQQMEQIRKNDVFSFGRSMGALSVLFASQLIMQSVRTMTTAVITSFMKISEAQTEAGKGLTTLAAHWEYLKFTVGNAIATALLPLIPTLTDIIMKVSEFIQKHPKLVTFGMGFLLIGSYIGFAAAQLVLLISGLKMLSGAATVGILFKNIWTWLFGSNLLAISLGKELKNIPFKGVVADMTKMEDRTSGISNIKPMWIGAWNWWVALILLAAASILSFPELRSSVAKSFESLDAPLNNLINSITNVFEKSVGLQDTWFFIGQIVNWALHAFITGLGGIINAIATVIDASMIMVDMLKAGYNLAKQITEGNWKDIDVGEVLSPITDRWERNFNNWKKWGTDVNEGTAAFMGADTKRKERLNAEAVGEKVGGEANEAFYTAYEKAFGEPQKDQINKLTISTYNQTVPTLGMIGMEKDNDNSIKEMKTKIALAFPEEEMSAFSYAVDANNKIIGENIGQISENTGVYEGLSIAQNINAEISEMELEIKRNNIEVTKEETEAIIAKTNALKEENEVKGLSTREELVAKYAGGPIYRSYSELQSWLKG